MSFMIAIYSADGDCIGTPHLFYTQKDAFFAYAEIMHKRFDIPILSYLVIIFRISSFGVEKIDSFEVVA